MLSVHMDKIIFTPPRDLSLHYRALKPQRARWAPVAWLRRKKGFWQFWQLGNVLVKSCKYEDTGPSCSSTPVMIDRFCGSLRHHTRVSLLFHCSCRIVSNNDQELMLVIGVVKKTPYFRIWRGECEQCWSEITMSRKCCALSPSNTHPETSSHTGKAGLPVAG